MAAISSRARRARSRAARILDALEGPFAITECSGQHSNCGIESNCRVGHAWQRVNGAIRRALTTSRSRSSPAWSAGAVTDADITADLRGSGRTPNRAERPKWPAIRTRSLEALVGQKYRHGFVTDIESDTVPPGLDEDVIRLISRKKGEPAFMLEWRLKAYRHWLTMQEPHWAHLRISPIDYQAISYYSAPKPKADAPKSLEEVDPKLLETYDKLGIPLHERARLAGVAVDAVFDSVSVATTFKERLAKAGVIFCSFSEAVQKHPELVEQYLGSVVPYTDNYFATLNSAVFTDGSFVFVPKGVRCPMELSTYFRINAANTGQFERTLIIAEEGALRELPRRLHGADAR